MAGDQAMSAEVALARALGPLRRSDLAAGHDAIAANAPGSHKNSGRVDDREPAGTRMANQVLQVFDPSSRAPR
jgi:hypothetical protein